MRHTKSMMALFGFLAAIAPVASIGGAAFAAGSLPISVPNGHVYWNNGDFITTAFTPASAVTANFVIMNCLDDNSNDAGTETFEVAITTDSGGNNVLASAQITNNFRNTGGCDAHKYSFDIADVALSGGTTYYLRTKVLAGAAVRAWSGAVLYYDGGIPDYDLITVDVPNGHVYWNNGDFITTAFSVPGGVAHFVTMACLDDNSNDAGDETFEVAITTDSGGNNVIASAQITNNFRNTGGCDRHMYLFDILDVGLSGGTTYYLRTKVLAGAEVRTWAADRLYYTASGPVCSVSPTALDFGTVDIGDYQDLDFTISNVGSGTLSGSVSESCEHYAIISGGGAYNLDPGEFRTVVVRFEPTSGGTKTCHISTGADCDEVACTGIGAVVEEIDVTQGSAPTVDGMIAADEYADAHLITFSTSGGTCTVYFKHDGANLYVAFDVPNLDAASAVQIFVDTDYDQASTPQPDDFRFTIARRSSPGEFGENQGTGSGWTAWGPPVGWSGARQDLASSWNAEFEVPFDKLGLTAGTPKTIGISFWNAWTASGDHTWPSGAGWTNPASWGAASSSDDWSAGLPPIICVSDMELSNACLEGENAPEQVFHVANCGFGTLSYTISCSSGGAWHPYGHRYAIIVMGGDVSGQLYEWYWGDTYGMYLDLIGHGFAADDIYYLSYGPHAAEHPEAVDASSTTANVRAAYQWAQQVCTNQDLLYIFWVDHGSPSDFVTHDGTISHAELGTLMDAIVARQILGAYNPCYSGAVIDDISRPGVISVTSQDAANPNSWGWAGTWVQALRGGYPGDSSDADGDGYISMTEAYQWICPKSQAAGEHSTYDDNGDTVGHQCTDAGFDPGDPAKDGYQGTRYSLDGWREPWLSCNPTSGQSTGEWDPITVTYQTASLAAGTYAGAIVITAPSALNSPLTIPVTLTVSVPGACCLPGLVDQECAVIGGGRNIHYFMPMGQEFVPTRGRHAAVELHLENWNRGAVTLSVHQGTITGPIIPGSTVSLTPDHDGWVAFVFGSPIELTPGLTYVIEAASDSNWGWGFESPGPYPNGRAILSGTPSAGSDQCFRTIIAAEGECEVLSEAECATHGAVWQGPYTDCDPNPCLHLGDLNCDGAVDFGDINPFVLALTDPDLYEVQFPYCNMLNGDCDQDGDLDFGDINPFVDLLSAN